MVTPDEAREHITAPVERCEPGEPARRTQHAPKLISVPALAREFDVTQQTIRGWMQRGEVKGVRIRGRWFVTRKSVIEYTKRRWA